VERAYYDVELDPPPGWTRTLEDYGLRRFVEGRVGPVERALFTSPDGKARIWFTTTDGRSAVPTRYEAMKRLCAGEIPGTSEEHRQIGSDRLPAYYYERTCEVDAGAETMVAVDVLLAAPGTYGPEVTTTAHVSDPNRFVLVSWLARDCPEARRLELATVIASIRRKR
jgi:hypothetical protein